MKLHNLRQEASLPCSAPKQKRHPLEAFAAQKNDRIRCDRRLQRLGRAWLGRGTSSSNARSLQSRSAADSLGKYEVLGGHSQKFAAVAVKPVATKNSESTEKSRVRGFPAVLLAACSSLYVPLSRFLPADSVVEPFCNWRTSPSVTSCTFFVDSGRVAPTVYDRALAVGLALPLMAALSGHDDVG